MAENLIENAQYSTIGVDGPTLSPIYLDEDAFQSFDNVEYVSQPQSTNEHYQQLLNNYSTETGVINWQDAHNHASLSSSNAVNQLVNQRIDHKQYPINQRIDFKQYPINQTIDFKQYPINQTVDFKQYPINQTVDFKQYPVNQTTLDLKHYPINQDMNPEQIHRANNERITYKQDVAVRYLKPPTPPPPAPVIVREIRAPSLPEAPPLVIHQRPPAPVTPPPMVIREQPPVPPPVEPPRIVNKYLPAPPPPPRKVIIERQAPLPQKPQPIIIEKWLPYKQQGERRVVVERAPPVIQSSVQKNTVITYDAPRVDLVKNVHELGTVRVDPQTYIAQYGTQLASSEYVLNTLAKFGLGNNYTQLVQMQTVRRPSAFTQNFSHQQLASADHGEYLEQYTRELALPDVRQRRHSAASVTNEHELRNAEIINSS